MKFIISLLAALFITFTPAFAQSPVCETSAQIATQIHEKGIPADTIVLRGERLKQFWANYTYTFMEPAPEGISEVMFVVFDDGRWYVLEFNDAGCHSGGPAQVNPEIIRQLMEGRSATN